MTAPEFYLQLDEMLELPAATITGTERLSDLGKWDSLACICFIALLDRQFGLTVPATRLLNCQTVSELVELTNGQVK